jgi:hypothetical protein
MLEFIIFLFLLQVKHWYIDFVNQSNIEIEGKGIYGNWHGIGHSLKHGIATGLIIVCVFGLSFTPFAAMLAIIDTLVHYHIDWIKINWGSRDMNTKTFWIHLGMDQMAHQLTYIALAAIIIL